jgi:hypothetical protein
MTPDPCLDHGGTMTNHEVIMQYQGFHPSKTTQDYLEDIFKEIQVEAPHKSTLKAIITKNKNLFKVSLDLHSHATSFFVAAEGTKLYEVGHRLLGLVRRKMSKWKKTRFHQRESIRHMEQREPEAEA